MILEIIIVAALAWLLRDYLEYKRKSTNLPGPRAWPIIGVVFNSKFYLTITEWTKIHGKILQYRLFSDNVVSISDAKLLKEVFSNEKVTGRVPIGFFQLYEDENIGVVNSEGNLWETHRRFTLRQLRDFGFGKSSMEAMISEEVSEFVDNLKLKEGQSVGNIKQLFTIPVVNSLWRIVSGVRYNHEDKKLKDLIAIVTQVVSPDIPVIGFFLPWLRHIAPDFIGYTSIRHSFETLKQFVKEAIAEHKKTFQPDSCRDFIDVYLKEMQDTKDPSSSFYGEFGEKQLTAVVADLFNAGTETTSTTLSWAINYLAMFPEVQQKLYKEIVATTGGTRDLVLDDKPKSSYLQAVLEEVHRVSSILPQGLQHVVTAEFTHNGIRFPKGTVVEPNVWHIHKNPETWGDPNNFRPERFLGENNTFKKNENVVSFSVGRRFCIGENLARDSLFLFLGNVIQQFEVSFDPSKPKPTLEPPPGFFLMPFEYSVIFKSRK